MDDGNTVTIKVNKDDDITNTLIINMLSLFNELALKYKKNINFEMLFLKCFKKMLKDAKEDEIVKLIYKFRYYILLPYDAEKDIKDVENLKSEILEIEKELLKIYKKSEKFNFSDFYFY